MAVKITDLVDQSAIDSIRNLNNEMSMLVGKYTEVARELAKGIEVPVKNLEELDRVLEVYNASMKSLPAINTQVNQVIEKQKAIIADTTNVVSRRLMEQERMNKATRDEYTEAQKVKELLAQVNGTYDENVKSLIRINGELAANKKQQSDLKKQYDAGRISTESYNQSLQALTISERQLKQEKQTTQTLLKNEEREMQAVVGSYNHMSQQLELLKKAYKSLNEEERGSQLGQELETTIQNLDAHLKDMAADMGEFQRNVGNYAIAGQNGVVATESLIAVLQQEAVTTKDLVDQNKILTEAKSMLNTEDANYAATLGQINAKIAENTSRLTDVTDIIDKQATSVAEAEAQNQRLTAALKQVDLSSADASERTAALNAKIAENNKIIDENSGKQASVKKNLKEMVLEIANLSIEYQNLTEEEKASAEGQALAEHIHQLTEDAGVLKDAISDTNQAIANASSDTRGFDQLSGSIQLAIDGFGLATGAAELLGISEGELAEVQTKLQAAIAASNAMSKIQNSLQKQSAVMQGVANIQTKAAAIAVKLKTAAEGKGVITTKLLTAAQWLFNKAAAANPIGLLVLGITACIAAVMGLIAAFKLFGGDSEARKQKYKEEAKALDDLKSKNEDLYEQAKARGASEAELANLSIKFRKEELEQAREAFAAAKKAYDEDEDEYKEALKAKQEAMGAFYDEQEKLHNKIIALFEEANNDKMRKQVGDYKYSLMQLDLEYEELKKSITEYRSTTEKAFERTIVWAHDVGDALKTSIGGGLSDILAKIPGIGSALSSAFGPTNNGIQGGKGFWQTLFGWGDAQTQEDKELAQLNDWREQKKKELAEQEAERAKELNKRRAEEAQRAAEELKKQVQMGEDALIKVIVDSIERRKQTEIKSYERSRKELLKKIAETNEEQTVLLKALQNQLEGLEKEHAEKMYQIEQDARTRKLKAEASLIASKLSVVKEGSEEELELIKQQLENRYQTDLEAIKKRVHDKEITEEQGEEERLNRKKKHDQDIVDAEEKVTKKILEEIAKRYGNEQSDRDNKYIGDNADLKKQYAAELKAAKGNAQKIAAAKAKYEAASAQLSQKYAEDTANASINMLEEQLKQENLSAEDKEEIRRKLAEARMKLSDMEADHELENVKNLTNEEEKAKNERIKKLQYWFGVASQALNGINSLAQSIYDAKVQRLEEEQESNQEAADKESELISDLVEKKVITQEEGDARQRALDERKAKKEEELAKKKQKLKERAAIWDKANNLAQVAMETALAIMTLWVTPAWPMAIPLQAVVGALGALQMATIAATPIPKYAKGTDYHPGGPALVGDGGRHEVVMYNGNAWLTPDTPTPVDLPQGAVVIPSINDIPFDFPQPTSTLQPINVNSDSPMIGQKIDRLGQKIDNVASTISAAIKKNAYLADYERYKNSRI